MAFSLKKYSIPSKVKSFSYSTEGNCESILNLANFSLG